MKAENILIFDFDGTIADTHHYIIEISNRLAKEFNYQPIAADEVDYLKDRTSQEVIQHLKIPVMKIPAILSRAKQEFQKGIDGIQPISGLKEILQQLKDTGLRMGILSSNTEENIRNFLDNHGLNVFDFIHSTPKVWSKNTSLKRLMTHYGLNPDQIIYVGDEIRDINAARKSGIRIAVVSWGYNSLQVLEKHLPDLVIHVPSELLKLCSFPSAEPTPV